MCSSSGTALSPMRRALCLSRSLNLVCKILILLLGLSKTSTIGLYRSLVAGGVMSGCLSWSSSGQGGVITRAIMSWVRTQGQQVDKTRLYEVLHSQDLNKTPYGRTRTLGRHIP